MKESLIYEKSIGSKLNKAFFDKLIYMLFIIFIVSALFTFFFKNNMHRALNFKSTAASLTGNLLLLSVVFKWLFPLAFKNSMKNISIKKNIKSSFMKNPEYIFLSLFVFLSFVSSLLSEYRHTAFFGNGYRVEGFFLYISYMGFFTAAISFKKQIKWKVLIELFLIMGYISGIIGIMEHYGIMFFNWSTSPRCSSFYINTNHFGYFLVIATILAGYMLITEKNGKVRYFRIAGYAILSFSLIYTDTRGVWIAHLTGLMFLCLFLSYKEGRFIKIFYLSPLFITIVVFVIIVVFENDVHVYRLASIISDTSLAVKNSAESGSAGSGRWELWNYAVQFIFKKPVFGHGPDTLGELYLSYDISMDRPHNEYLQYAATIGIPGLLAYLSALFIIIKRAVKNIKYCRKVYIAVLCACIGYLVSAFFGNTTTYVTPYFWMLLGYLTTAENKFS